MLLFSAGMEAILTYSESAKQLLRRKKVKREHIVMYLAEKNQQASHTEDKTSLVKRVLDYWEKNNISRSTVRGFVLIEREVH